MVSAHRARLTALLSSDPRAPRTRGRSARPGPSHHRGLAGVQSPRLCCCKREFRFAALHALGVPRAVQHVEQKPVQDGPLAARALDHVRGPGVQDHRCGALRGEADEAGQQRTAALRGESLRSRIAEPVSPSAPARRRRGTVQPRSQHYGHVSRARCSFGSPPACFGQQDRKKQWVPSRHPPRGDAPGAAFRVGSVPACSASATGSRVRFCCAKPRQSLPASGVT
ncbi:hypothetical protein AOLI_G00269810 [Acnodon oligacanthus]